MTKGKSICNVLKTIRMQVAKANDIKYEPRECHHQGECQGTCPACEAEVRYIQRQLDIRRQLGKAVTIVGISAGLSALSSCGDKAKKVETAERHSLTEGKVMKKHVERDSSEVDDYDGIVLSDAYEKVKIRTAPFKVPKKVKKNAVSCEETSALKDSVSETPLQEDVSQALFGDISEQMPMFPGGEQALIDYLAENVHYPDDESCAQGRVIVSFVIEKDGSITDPKVVRSIAPPFDNEALRVVRGMPKWIPGYQNGERVRVKYTLPISFRLR